MTDVTSVNNKLEEKTDTKRHVQGLLISPSIESSQIGKKCFCLCYSLGFLLRDERSCETEVSSEVIVVKLRS